MPRFRIETALDRRCFLKFSAAGAMAAFWGNSGLMAIGADAPTTESPLKIHTDSPRNAEPALHNLVRQWMTPTDQFYVRSHAPNPKVDLSEFRLRVEGLVEKPLTLTLAELQSRFKKQSVIATLTCAGNRRAEMSEIKPIGGVQWQAGAIGNAQWGGVRLSDVLKAAGLKADAKHVWFEGLDQIQQGEGVIPFGGSIPLTKALNDSDAMPGALLSSEMNEQPLTADHGAPLRSVVPGYIGARSVKWLGRIIVSNRPSPNHYVAHAYKLVLEDTPLAWDEAGVIYRFPVNSVTCDSSECIQLKPGSIAVRGYALPTGDGGTITKVEISADNGQSWGRAKLPLRPAPYCWTLWDAVVPFKANSKNLLQVRATDSNGHVQPQTAPWNFKGYLNNSWHRVPVNVN